MASKFHMSDGVSRTRCIETLLPPLRISYTRHDSGQVTTGDFANIQDNFAIEQQLRMRTTPP